MIGPLNAAGHPWMTMGQIWKGERAEILVMVLHVQIDGTPESYQD